MIKLAPSLPRSVAAFKERKTALPMRARRAVAFNEGGRIRMEYPVDEGFRSVVSSDVCGASS